MLPIASAVMTMTTTTTTTTTTKENKKGSNFVIWSTALRNRSAVADLTFPRCTELDRNKEK